MSETLKHSVNQRGDVTHGAASGCGGIAPRATVPASDNGSDGPDSAVNTRRSGRNDEISAPVDSRPAARSVAEHAAACAALRARLAESASSYPPAPLAAAPASLPRTPSSGARDGAGDLLNGGVFDRPACVSRFLRQRRIRLVVAWVVAVAVLAAVEWVVVGLFVKWTSGE